MNQILGNIGNRNILGEKIVNIDNLLKREIFRVATKRYFTDQHLVNNATKSPKIRATKFQEKQRVGENIKRGFRNTQSQSKMNKNEENKNRKRKKNW